MAETLHRCNENENERIRQKNEYAILITAKWGRKIRTLECSQLTACTLLRRRMNLSKVNKYVCG